MRGYTIKVYLSDGSWGFIRPNDNGGFNTTQNVGSALCFPTMADAKEYYFSHVKGAYDSRTGISVESGSLLEVNY